MIEKTELITVEEVAKKFISLWGIDHNTENFEEKLNKFVGQVGKNIELKNIYLNLLKEYQYYSRRTINGILEEINKIIANEYHLEKIKTIYSRIEDDSKIDSSNTMLEEYKIINRISNNYSHDLTDLEAEDFEDITNIIFIDDIIGSGQTIKSFFEMHINKLRNVSIYVFCIVILNDAKLFLEKYFKENKINCIIHSQNVNQKAFHRGFIFDDTYQIKEQIMLEHEKKIWGRSNNYILGFKNSQALVSFYRNTPNNTLSSFWYEGENWEGLFPRKNDAPLFLKGRNRRKRNAAYNMTALRNRN